MKFSTIRNLLALLLGMLAIMTGISYQAVVLGVSGAPIFNDIELGIITSMNFVGFLLGSMYIPKSVNKVGHVRCFAAMTAVFSSAILLFAVLTDIYSWSLLQLLSGFASAGLFVVAESWLNDATENSQRGQLMGIYLVICMLGKIIGYNLASIGDVSSYAHFTAISIVISLAGVPMLLSAGSSPTLNPPEHLNLLQLYKVSPTGIIAVAVNAIVVGMVNGYGPVYGARIGLDTNMVAYFMSAIMIGAMFCQLPIGSISDFMDRRYVMIAVCTTGVITSLLLITMDAGNFWYWIVLVIFGGCSFTIYPLGCAHTNDFLRPSQRVAACGGLLITASVGMSIGPFLGGVLVELFGTEAFFGISIVCAGSLGLFILTRLRVRDAPASEQSADFVPIGSRGTVAVAEMVALESDSSEEST